MQNVDNISHTRQQLEARNKAGKKNEKKHGEHFLSLTFIAAIDNVCLSNSWYTAQAKPVYFMPWFWNDPV